MPNDLSWKGRKVLIDTGFIIDLVQRFKRDASLILLMLAKENEAVIQESNWEEFKVHHNTRIGGNREIDGETMFVLNQIRSKDPTRRDIFVSQAIKDQVLLTYWDLFEGDTRKYEKDPLGENDEEIVGVAMALSLNYPVAVLSTDSHVNRIIREIRPNVLLYGGRGD